MKRLKISSLVREWRDNLLWCYGAIAAAIAAFVLLAHLTHSGLWIDEIYTLHAISLPWREMFFERLARGHFPLYFGFLKLWLGAVGVVSESTLRLPSFLFWILAVLAYARFIRSEFPSPIAPFAFVFFALNGLAVRQAMEARMYTLLLLLAVIICAAYLKLVREPRHSRARWALLLVPPLAFWTSSTVALTLGALVVDAVRRRRRDLFGTLLGSLAIVAVTATIPAFLHASTRERSEIAHVPPLALFLHLMTFLTGLLGWEDYYKLPEGISWLWAGGLTLTAGMLLALVRMRRSLPETVKTAAIVTFLPLALMGVTYLVEKSVGWQIALHGPARYIIGSLPFAAMISGYVCASLFRETRRTQIAFLALTAILLIHSFFVAGLPLESCRELVQKYFAKQYRTGDAVVVVPIEAKEAVQFYAPHVKIDESFPRNLSEDDLRKRLEIVAKRERLWLVWIHGKQSKAIDVADALFGKGISSSPRHYKGERRVFLYQQSDATSDSLMQRN